MVGLNRSEHEWMEEKVRKRTIRTLFMDEFKLDAYITRHMYGISKPDKEDDFLESSFYPGMQERDMTFMKQKATFKKDSDKIKKIGALGTYFAILKGYCALSILIIPKAF